MKKFTSDSFFNGMRIYTIAAQQLHWILSHKNKHRTYLWSNKLLSEMLDIFKQKLIEFLKSNHSRHAMK